jgi:hypothetical protein
MTTVQLTLSPEPCATCGSLLFAGACLKCKGAKR